VRIAYLLQRAQPDDPTPRINPVTDEIIGRLRARGALVDLVVPENACVDIGDVRPLYDLYVLKSKTPLALSLAGALAMAGARFINTVEACHLVRDKVVCTALLAASGVPVPPSWATGQAAKLLPLVREKPLWVKPQRGSKGRGVLRVDSAAELGLLPPGADPCGLPLPLFAQEEAPSEGSDLKVYVAGGRAWAIAKPWPVRTVEDKLGRPAFLPPAIEAVALACGRALGLEIYGVDFLVCSDGFVVVDVNALPGFRGPAEGPACIADYIYTRALQPDGHGPNGSGPRPPLAGGSEAQRAWLAERVEPPTLPGEVGAPA
jgi:ribosomal protein S6--L-glutamate ligase